MTIIKKDIHRNTHVGLFMLATDRFVLVPDILEDEEIEEIARVLKVDPIPTRIAGTSLIGVFAAGNSSGVVVPYIAREDEVKGLKEHGIDVLMIKDVPTALGNLIAANDRGAVISKSIREENVKRIAEFLGVDAEWTNIAGTELVGASIVATNRGFLAHPNTTEEELRMLQRVFGVEGTTTTVNYGDPFVRTAVVNSYGVIVGDDTSPVELMRIEDVLG